MYLKILVTTFKFFSSVNPKFFHNLITNNGFVGKLLTSVNNSVKRQVYNILQCELNMN
jgi:hypothetical protein